MRSSSYIHIILYITCFIFLFSFINFLLRIGIHFHPSRLKKTSSIYNDHSSTQATFLHTTNFKYSLTVENNDSSLREKVLGINSKNNSIFNRFIYINPPKLICNNLENGTNTLIIIVLSRALNLDYRHAIRNTWGRKGKYKSSNITIKTLFFVGIDDGLHSAIRNEQTLFNDVIEINIPENPVFMAHKELSVLFWLRLYCPLVHILFRIDDDIILDIFLLLNHIEHQIKFNKKDGIYGWFRSGKPVLRSGRWAVTKSEYKEDIYPAYTFSLGYLYSNKTCQQLIDTANHPKHHIARISDAYITGILRHSARIPFQTYSDLNHFMGNYNGVSCNNEFTRRPRLLVCTSRLHYGMRGNPYEFYDNWQGLLRKYNKTLLTI